MNWYRIFYVWAWLPILFSSSETKRVEGNCESEFYFRMSTILETIWLYCSLAHSFLSSFEKNFWPIFTIVERSIQSQFFTVPVGTRAKRTQGQNFGWTLVEFFWWQWVAGERFTQFSSEFRFSSPLNGSLWSSLLRKVEKVVASTSKHVSAPQQTSKTIFTKHKSNTDDSYQLYSHFPSSRKTE